MTTVLIGNVNPGMVTSDFMVSVWGFSDFDTKDEAGRKVLRGYLPWRAGALLDIYRNMIIETFLTDYDFEWLWFLDSDVQIDNTTLYTLLDAADPSTRPVLTGIYPTLDRWGVPHPSLWYRGQDEQGRSTMVQHNTIPPADEDGLILVDGCGAGCLLIHRSLLQAMRNVFPAAKPWFDMGVLNHSIPIGEDFTFCDRVSQMGYPILAHKDALVDHYKDIKLTLRIPVSDKVEV